MSFDLKEFQRLSEAATDAPWQANRKGELTGREGAFDVDLISSTFCEGAGFEEPADAEFCAYVGTHREQVASTLDAAEVLANACMDGLTKGHWREVPDALDKYFAAKKGGS